MLSHPIFTQSPGYLLPALAGVTGILLALGAWNVTLRRRIAQRTSELTREIEAGRQRTEELRRSEELLRRSEEKYRQIYENAPIAIFQSTLEGRFLSLNPAAATMFLYQSAQEMITSITNIPEQLFVHPEQRSELLRCLLASDGFLRREVEYIRKDGTAFSANLYMRAVRSGKEVLYLEGFVEDITERKHAYELTRTLNVELEQRVHERTVELEARKRRRRSSSSAARSGRGSRSTMCVTTAPASTWPTPTISSASSSACTPPPSSRAPGSAWPPSSASSAVTAGGSGPSPR